jgi:hypothetical protein
MKGTAKKKLSSSALTSSFSLLLVVLFTRDAARKALKTLPENGRQILVVA